MDPTHLSEIERIQAEIERDLELAWKLDIPETPTPEIKSEAEPESEAEPPAPFEASIIDFETPTTTPDDTGYAFAVSDAAHETEGAAPKRESFYHETIKVENAPPPRKARSWPRTVAVVCLVCTLGTASLGFGLGAASVYFTRERQGINAPVSGENADGGYSVVSTQYAFNDLSAANGEVTLSEMISLVEPSVVNVSAVYEAEESFGGTSVPTNVGSGIIFSEDADRVYIATNYHVVRGATSATVTLTGHDPVKAYSIGYDAEADLQVLFVEKRDLQKVGIQNFVIATFGDSDEMDVGDMVLAIGNAMGEGNAATQGIISAKEKEITTAAGRKLIVLQTDAAINQGSSGGPLINAMGEVIGINTTRLPATYDELYAEGMGYSVAANIAKPILEDLMNRTSRPALGIYGETVTLALLQDTGYDIPPMGVLVRSIISNSSAEKADIQRSDIITGFNGQPVLSMEQLVNEIQSCQVGDQVEVKILRGGSEILTLPVTLGEVNNENF